MFVSPLTVGTKKKPSLRVLAEVVVITLIETQREASALALPLQGAVYLEVYYVSANDCFAAFAN